MSKDDRAEAKTAAEKMSSRKELNLGDSLSSMRERLEHQAKFNAAADTNLKRTQEDLKALQKAIAERLGNKTIELVLNDHDRRKKHLAELKEEKAVREPLIRRMEEQVKNLTAELAASRKVRRELGQAIECGGQRVVQLERAHEELAKLEKKARARVEKKKAGRENWRDWSREVLEYVAATNAEAFASWVTNQFDVQNADCLVQLARVYVKGEPDLLYENKGVFLPRWTPSRLGPGSNLACTT